MVDLDWKAKMVSSEMPNKSPKLSNKLHLTVPASARAVQAEISAASSSACSAYESYLRLPELRKLWGSKEFPEWRNESVLKPALMALEITFRFVSTALSDPRPYANRREWKRRLVSLTKSQIELIAALIEDGEEEGAAPIADSSSAHGVLARDGSSAEVWRIAGGDTTVVSRTSEASLLPRLAMWQTSEDVAEAILYSLECAMRRCPYTLGLGEPNLAGKPTLEYDAVAKPSELHALKKCPYDHEVGSNYENQTVYTTHQVLESWIQSASELLGRAAARIESRSFEAAASDCCLIERIWKLLAEIFDLHLLMDPDDFLRLKNQLAPKSMDDSDAFFCFRSRKLVEITKLCKDLRHRVPYILGVEVDPTGGPRIQEAVMRLYSEEKGGAFEKVHLLQALQAIESALKRFFYAYKQVLVVVMGSLEARGNRVVICPDSCDALSQIFLEPTYFPSLDAAKTFLGNGLTQEQLGGLERRTRSK
ncbi:ematode resistance protein-like HSPRO1 protein [Trema orientale]|uniref:Ematode resistance protein-like HSPRO1 protein n=1 Tax=Trema orientale TaxID=63057 RepID=A0A2P5FBP8_TREOI|nr:ematode resistance protein-like HSPRO1 protein [Trema orientale]